MPPAHDGDVMALGRFSSLVATTAAVVLVGSCSTASSIDRDELEEEVSTQLEDEVGVAPDDVECPEDLQTEVGASVVCVLTAGSDELDVAVEITAVEDDRARFDIQVEDPADGAS